jgi:hypothetical protein
MGLAEEISEASRGNSRGKMDGRSNMTIERV